MRRLAIALVLGSCVPLAAGTGDPAGPGKPDYREFSRLVQRLIVKQLPREFEDKSGWGETIPIPPKLPLPRLRTYLKVDDHYELPHGPWRRIKGWLEDPARDVTVRVRDFKKVDDKTYRLALDADAVVACEGEWQQWQKGLLLVGVIAQADASFTIGVVCDVGVTLKKPFPPELAVEPKVQELHVDLKDLTFRGPPGPDGTRPPAVGDRLKEILRQAIRLAEPALKDRVNEAIAEALRQGSGTLSAGALLKAVPAPAPPKK